MWFPASQDRGGLLARNSVFGCGFCEAELPVVRSKDAVDAVFIQTLRAGAVALGSFPAIVIVVTTAVVIMVTACVTMMLSYLFLDHCGSHAGEIGVPAKDGRNHVVSCGQPRHLERCLTIAT